MDETILRERVEEAYRMLDAFVSVGCRRFSLARTDLNRIRRDFRSNRNTAAMRLILPHLVSLCWDLHQNLIVRPEKPAQGVLAQLDDLDAGRIERLRSTAFLIVETSPGNHQVWIVIEAGDDNLVKRLMKGAGADSRANCAGRMAGSPNCKPKHAPDFPAVRIVAVQSALRTTPAVLDSLGLLPAIAAPPNPPRPRRIEPRERRWPDYERCLLVAPRKTDGTPDRSLADLLWSKWAIERGHTLEGTVIMLVQVSEKAREEWDRGNQNYARRTVDAAYKRVRTEHRS